MFAFITSAGMTGSVSFFFFSSRRRHTRLTCDWSSDVCSSDLREQGRGELRRQFPAGRGVGRELPLERFRGNAVVEKILLHAVLGAERLVDPPLRSAAGLAHVLAQGALAR